MKFGYPWLDPDITRMMASLNAPPFDVEAATTAHRKNVEAMSAACMLALDCIQESARRQASILAEAVDQVFTAARTLSANSTMNGQSADPMAAQRELFERGLANMRDLAELIAKSNSQAFDIVSKRAADCLGEMKDIAGKTGGT